MLEGIVGVDYPGIAVVFFCHDDRGRFLAGKRSAWCRDEVGKWDIGSGEFNPLYENASQALKRQVRKQYGVPIIKHEELGRRYVVRKYGNETTNWLCIDFKVLVNAQELKGNMSGKLEAIGWFPQSEPPSPDEAHSQLYLFLDKYKLRKLKK